MSYSQGKPKINNISRILKLQAIKLYQQVFIMFLELVAIMLILQFLQVTTSFPSTIARERLSSITFQLYSIVSNCLTQFLSTLLLIRAYSVLIPPLAPLNQTKITIYSLFLPLPSPIGILKIKTRHLYFLSILALGSLGRYIPFYSSCST